MGCWRIVGPRVSGFETDVEIPFGVDTPGRPPRICPVPGILALNAAPPPPGALPSKEDPEPTPRKLEVSLPGACAFAVAAPPSGRSTRTMTTVRRADRPTMSSRAPCRGKPQATTRDGNALRQRVSADACPDTTGPGGAIGMIGKTACPWYRR